MGTNSPGGEKFHWERAAAVGVGAAALLGAWYAFHERPETPDFDWRGGPSVSVTPEYDTEVLRRGFFDRLRGVYGALQTLNMEEDELQGHTMVLSERCQREKLGPQASIETVTLEMKDAPYPLSFTLATEKDGQGNPTGMTATYIGPRCVRTEGNFAEDGDTWCAEVHYIASVLTGSKAANLYRKTYGDPDDPRNSSWGVGLNLFYGPLADSFLPSDEELVFLGGYEDVLAEETSMDAVLDKWGDVCDGSVEALESPSFWDWMGHDTHTLYMDALDVIHEGLGGVDIPEIPDEEFFWNHGSSHHGVDLPIEIDSGEVMNLSLFRGDDPENPDRAWITMQSESYMYGCRMVTPLEDVQADPELMQDFEDCYYDGKASQAVYDQSRSW